MNMAILMQLVGSANKKVSEHLSSNLMTFPWIKSRIDKGTLNVHGFHFDMVSGDLEQIHLPAYKPQEEAARV